jgi:hypothetical protein
MAPPAPYPAGFAATGPDLQAMPATGYARLRSGSWRRMVPVGTIPGRRWVRSSARTFKDAVSRPPSSCWIGSPTDGCSTVRGTRPSEM